MKNKIKRIRISHKYEVLYEICYSFFIIMGYNIITLSIGQGSKPILSLYYTSLGTSLFKVILVFTILLFIVFSGIKGMLIKKLKDPYHVVRTKIVLLISIPIILIFEFILRK